MSYLYRSGNGRNNIAYTNTANSSTKYLRRLGSGRTNINWYTIPQGSTYNILQRNGTGRNNILWSNLKIGPDLSANGIKNNMHIITITLTDAVGHEQNDWATMYTKPTGSTGMIAGHKDITYNNNQIIFGEHTHTKNGSMSGYRSENKSIWDQYFDGYLCVSIFCSQSPPSEYLNRISSVALTTGGTFDVRYIKYGLYYANNYNVLAISLNSTYTRGWINTIYFT